MVKDHLCLGDNGLLKADNIRLMVERHQLKAPVYIGDIQGDADASYAAGVEFIHAAYGFGKVDRCYAAVDEPRALIDVIER